MADKNIETLSIALELDPTQVNQALQQVADKINDLLRSFDQVGPEAESAQQQAAATTEQTTAATNELNRATQDYGRQGERVFSAMTGRAGGFSKSLMMLSRQMRAALMPLMGFLGGRKMFAEYMKAEDLQNQAKAAKTSAEALSTWARANEAAGGSAKGFSDALTKYVQTTGRSAESFMEMGEKLRDMGEEAQDAYLKANNLSREQVAIWTIGKERADELVETFRETAFTAQDAENVRRYREAWASVRVTFQAISTVVMRAVLPILTEVGELVSSAARTLARHQDLIKVIAAGLTAFFGAKAIGGALLLGRNLASVLSLSRGLGKAFGGVGKILSSVLGAALIGVAKFALNIHKATGVGGKFMAIFGGIGRLILLPLRLVGGALTWIGTIVAAVALAFEDIIVFIKGGNSAIGEVLKRLGVSDKTIETIRKTVGKIVDKFGEWFEKGKKIGSFLGGAVFKAIALIATGIAGLLTLVTLLFDWIFNDSEEAGEALKEIWEKFKDACADAWEFLKGWFAEKVKGLWEEFKQGFRNIFGVGKYYEKDPNTGTYRMIAAQNARAGATTNNVDSRTEININAPGGDPTAIGNAVKGVTDRQGDRIAGLISAGASGMAGD